MAQQHTSPTGTTEDEPNGLFWARRYLRHMNSADRLGVMATSLKPIDPDRQVLWQAQVAMEQRADSCLQYAHDCGGLLFCWLGSSLEGGAA